MPDARCRRAQKQVRKKAMSVRAHGHEVATLLLDPLDNLIRRLTVRQFGLCRNANGFELGPYFF